MQAINCRTQDELKGTAESLGWKQYLTISRYSFSYNKNKYPNGESLQINSTTEDPRKKKIFNKLLGVLATWDHQNSNPIVTITIFVPYIILYYTTQSLCLHFNWSLFSNIMYIQVHILRYNHSFRAILAEFLFFP